MFAMDSPPQLDVHILGQLARLQDIQRNLGHHRFHQGN
jgi:hypothetical protein